jgi:hypothetical protein
MAIKIGDVQSLGKARNWNVIPDDRQTNVKLIDSPYNKALDAGRYQNGDIYQFSATFTSAAWATVQNYWNNRTKVTVITDGGETLTGMRIVVKAHTWPDQFEKTHVDATIELWGV